MFRVRRQYGLAWEARLITLSAVSGGASQASPSSSPGAASTSEPDFSIGGEDAAAGSNNQQSSTSADAWGSLGLHHLDCVHG